MKLKCPNCGREWEETRLGHGQRDCRCWHLLQWDFWPAQMQVPQACSHNDLHKAGALVPVVAHEPSRPTP
jgi:hypothetical protein